MNLKNLYALLLLALPLTSLAQNSVLKIDEYKLDNGLTVCLNHDPFASEVYGAVVVRAGSKNDPPDATGIAHYLEHLLFKGTNELGTLDYEKEKPHLDSIKAYYELLGKTNDQEERKRIQNLINEQSVLASEYGLPNEFDKLIKSIGGEGVNAYTNDDVTVYHNSFPPAQMDKWLQLYSHRFVHPVFRSFQSELEVVYEEKNRAMDNMERKLLEIVNRNLFGEHPYGSQTTLGSVEHLKNPSLNKMYEFFNTYYVANNMGLVLCGNFDTTTIKPMIETHFSKLKSGDIPKFPDYEPKMFTKNETVNVRYSPIKVEVIGFKTFPEGHEDEAAMEVATDLLFNYSETGLMDKLLLENKLFEAGGFNIIKNDDGAYVFLLVPKLVGQSFGKAESLLFNQIEKLKNGDITDDALESVKTQLYLSHQRSLESHWRRAYGIVNVYGSRGSLDDYINYDKKIEAVTKADVMRVVEKYFTKPHFTLRSRTGRSGGTVLEKPGYKPVVRKQIAESEFAQAFNAHQIPPTPPKFIDKEKDVDQLMLNPSNQLYTSYNPMNDVFDLTISYLVGEDSLKNLNLTSDLFNYFHTDSLNLEEMKKSFARLGLSYYSRSTRNRFQISFTGLEKNLEASIKLINQLVYHPVVDDKSMKLIYNDEKANRKFETKDPSTIGGALIDYAMYGERATYLDRLSLKTLKKIKSGELVAVYNKAITYNSSIRFVGRTSAETVKDILNTHLELANNQKKVPVTPRLRNTTSENLIYLTHDKKSVQSHVNFYVPSIPHQFTIEEKSRFGAFNEYMGGGFSGLILQEIREYRSLAYSSWGYLGSSLLPGQNAFFRSYIGCQGDKTNEAIDVMLQLIDSMPEKPDRIESIKLGLKNKASGKYPGFRSIASYVEYGKIYGDAYLFSPEEYRSYDSLEFSDISEVYKQFVQNRPKVITISGNLSRIDEDQLSKLGKVIHVKKDDLFKK